ncbi:MAG TPA: hypothetical protein VM899_05705, partial [Rubellimicrobium sp.]|nr:hypothetical protein [Rubellimicrobium sp.]
MTRFSATAKDIPGHQVRLHQLIDQVGARREHFSLVQGCPSLEGPTVLRDAEISALSKYDDVRERVREPDQPNLFRNVLLGSRTDLRGRDLRAIEADGLGIV